MVRQSDGQQAPAGGASEAGTGPVASVVVCAFNSRWRIDTALRALAAQDFAEPYEVIVVDSGGDGCADHVEQVHPWARVVRSARRLYAGGARNAGVAAARGRYVAFCPDDGVACPAWLRLRVAKHREGFEAVGGSIGNGTPYHPVGCADYFAEYTDVIPSRAVLERQNIPHCLSYERALLERVGPYPEDVMTGEDTVLNERCLATGASISFEPGARITHRNLRRLGRYLRHHWGHGRGLARCVVMYDHASPIGRSGQPAAVAAVRAFGVYPALRWGRGLRRIARGKPAWIVPYLAVSPLLMAGYVATASGALTELRALAHRNVEPAGAGDISDFQSARRHRAR